MVMSAALFDASQYRRDTPVNSYWRAFTTAAEFSALTRDTQCDVAIIGGGLAGLSAALHLCRDHHLSVVVLEGGDLAWGASGRNAGFVTLPATKYGCGELFSRFGEANARDFLRSQADAIDVVAHLIEHERIDAMRCGHGSVTVAHQVRAMADLISEYEALKRAGIAVQLIDQKTCRETIHDTPTSVGALQINAGFALNPLAFCDGLARAAARHGARIFTHSLVRSWQRQQGHHVLHTAAASVRANYLYLATNAYRDHVDSDVTQRRFVPAISNIAVTAPIDDSVWQALRWMHYSPIADTKHLLHYYRRLPDNRLLLGARGDLVGDTAAAQKMRQQLQRDMARLFPPLGDSNIEFFWNGLVSLTRKMLPTFGTLPDDQSVYFHLGCFGNGVNTMPWIGRAIARRIAGVRGDDVEHAALYQSLPATLPSARFLRRAGLQCAYWHYALRDRFF